MDQIDDIARRSAGAVREQAGAVADTERGLADLRAGVTVAPVVPMPDGRDRRWITFAAAAAVIGLVAGSIVLATTRDGTKRIVATPPTEVAVPQPSTTLQPAPSTTAASVSSAGTTQLTIDDAEVLYEAAVGEGADQLGREDCQECEPLRALAPMVTADGRVIIGDPVNDRWVIVTDGAAEVVDYDASMLVLDAVLGLDGFVYAIVYDQTAGGLREGRVEQLDGRTLAFLSARAPDGGLSCCTTLVFDGAVADPADSWALDTATGEAIVRPAAPSGIPTVSAVIDGDSLEITATGPGDAGRGWGLVNRGVGLPALTALRDGSVVAIQTIALDAGGMVFQVDRLLAGSVASHLLPEGVEMSGYQTRWFVDASGTTTIEYDASTETYRVLRFRLPGGAVVPAPATVRVALGHGLVASLPSAPDRIRRVESLAYDADRAQHTTDVRFADGTNVRVVLGVDVLGRSAPGDVAWEEERDVGEVDAAAGRRLDGDTWARVESVRAWNPEAREYEGPSIGLDGVRLVLGSITYDPSADTRVRPMMTAPPRPADSCAPDAAVGGGGPDMVLFLCDGRFGVFDGATGELVELLRQFDDQRVPFDGEGPGPAYVDGVAVSADGSTIWFSTGPEPAVGNMYRYVRGSGVEPEPIGFGWGPSISPDGTTVAVAQLDWVGMFSADGTPVDVTSGQPNALLGMFPTPPFAWSPDGAQIAFEVHSGVIAVLDVATEDVALYAPTEPGTGYVEPGFEAERGLTAMLICCNGAPGSSIGFAIVGGQGNQLNLEVTGDDSTTWPLRRVFTQEGRAIFLRGGVLGPPGESGGEVWATGVLEAAFLPASD